MLRAAHRYLGSQASSGYDISPAADWLLDNFHLIEAQLREVHEGLPRSYYRSLPILSEQPLAGLPRVYGIAWAFVAHTDGEFEEDSLVQFLRAYQEKRELDLSELWALPTTLRVVLIENLRRLSQRVAYQSAAREVANICCDRIDTCAVPTLDQLLARFVRMGVGRTFVDQMTQRLHDRWARVTGACSLEHEGWLQMAMKNYAMPQAQQNSDQAADNLSVLNAVTSLRSIGAADWPDIIENISSLMRVMLTSKLFEAESYQTRDITLRSIERLAIRCDLGEADVARKLLGLMNDSDSRQVATKGAADMSLLASHWLEGGGRPVLKAALGHTRGSRKSWKSMLRPLALPAYLAALIALTIMIVSGEATRFSSLFVDPNETIWKSVVIIIAMLFPASEAAVALINRIISESIRPQKLPRLGLRNGVPIEHRVIVVIPVLLTTQESIQNLTHRLMLHFLANSENHAQFAILSDWTDGNAEFQNSDSQLLEFLRSEIRALNEEFPARSGESPRFVALHRPRRYSKSERAWIGWERKRGKIEQLIALIAENQSISGNQTPFLDLGEESRVAPDTRYVLTLDSDTQLPPGRLRELVAVAAHPQNQPRLDASGRKVTAGYSILQPRVSTPLAAPDELTHFHWLFAGQCGIDPYSAASSEVYQDLFREGSFTGKGLLNVGAMYATLARRLPDDAVLSHDLLEGSIARCAAVTDITLLEQAPFHADVAASRAHRWMRGDWQLLPFLLSPGRYSLSAVSAWKMFDNMRRSLVPPMALALIVLSFIGIGLSPLASLTLVFAAYCTGPLIGAIAGLATHRENLAKSRFLAQAAVDLMRALGGGLWHLAQLLQQAMLASDAITRALYRTLFSRRHMLQWTTADAASALAKSNFLGILTHHWKEPCIAFFGLILLFGVGTSHPILATVMCTVWGASPLWIWWSVRPSAAPLRSNLPSQDATYLNDVARDTWRLFERCIVAQDKFLPPDNLQTLPYDAVAHRTSPTNIGLYLLSTACARQFGWIGTEDYLQRLEETLATLESMERYNGHFFNWYDTQSGAPLLPKYVSTVDSGNLSGHLLAVAQACQEIAKSPSNFSRSKAAVQCSALRIQVLLDARADNPTVYSRVLSEIATARLLEMNDPLVTASQDSLGFCQLIVEAQGALKVHLPKIDDAAHLSSDVQGDPLVWYLEDHLATLASATRDLLAPQKAWGKRLLGIAERCQHLAWLPDFRFLYHRKRHLLHIGYRVAEQQLDASFYDLMASESRLTSLLAIAKGDVPVSHWSTLGRPFYALTAKAGLRSWSGSMFEYLMPSLILDEPAGGMLREACRVAIREQVNFASSQGVPWGISESAYAGRDYTLAYQYAPQGVPRLALRRTPSDELVIAPYATALAAQLDPQLACINFRALEKIAPRTRYGFLESIDFTVARQTDDEPFTLVSTFMAHHQGMTIVALANVLLKDCARAWAMRDPRLEAVASLLQEKAPREISTLQSVMPGPPSVSVRASAPALLRDVSPGAGALEPTHLLSNGRYSVSLRSNGAGWSRWGKIGITRWRDDVLRDAYGSFFYMRWDRQPRAVSLTQHPAPDPQAHYHSVFHADRVRFEANWPEIQTHSTVWVSPEDDIEFRQVELINTGSRTLDVELHSVFEPTLAEYGADEAHPAFANLFVSAAWLPSVQALMFSRSPRLGSEKPIKMTHFLAESDPQVRFVRFQTDRRQWHGRNGTASYPLASFKEPPSRRAGSINQGSSDLIDLDGQALETGLDPVCALAVTVRLVSGSKAQLTFATAASHDPTVLLTLIDKYRQTSHVQRASLMSATMTNIRFRALSINPKNFSAIQSLTTALVLSLSQPGGTVTATDTTDTKSINRQRLWRFGISGDRPFVLVTAGVNQSIGLIRSLAKALQVWSWGGVPCDLVVVNSEPTSYEMLLQREVVTLRERHIADAHLHAQTPATGFHILRIDELTTEELTSLQALAALRFLADGRPITHHVQVWVDAHEAEFEQRHEKSRTAMQATLGLDTRSAASSGKFSVSSGEFDFEVSAQRRPAKPWINILSNPAFGAQISESGGGYTWAVNSRLNQLTAWSNDPVSDPPSEWFVLQDSTTLETWSVAPSAWAAKHASYHIKHGQGYTAIDHIFNDLQVTASWCVDEKLSVKQIRLEIVNHSRRARRLRLLGMTEWMMGASRRERVTTRTSLFRQRLPNLSQAFASGQRQDQVKLTALLCTQQEQSSGFGDGTAFFGVADMASQAEDWTCDRREFFDARGSLVLPEVLGQRSGEGLDPCAALSIRLTLAAGEKVERVFLLGYAHSPDAARALATEAAVVLASKRMEQVRQSWDTFLGATTVATSDPLFDAMVNRWLLYQTVSCRLWAKAGFYQAGGATGFRDQLQDALALTWAEPETLRQQILLAASRQFPEGDVQHWWHAPSGAGVRTHFSDDLLWLAYACIHYLRATGDAGLLDEQVLFIDGTPIPPMAEDVYETPKISQQRASVFEHAARAIDRSLVVGMHGLPLMGGGDWNDGMNRVGHLGAGESVWLGWFLCSVVTDFLPLARARQEKTRVEHWEQALTGWKAALETQAWDGQWFKRAFFDNGQALGSKANSEAQIDLIAQAWSVLSNAAPLALQSVAMASADVRLVDSRSGLIRLLDPPLASAQPSAGYIQAYPPGVRENGGQYTHAGVWALMAQAELARRSSSSLDRDKVYRYFRYLNPAHRAEHPDQGPAYEIEPYAVAGDVYAQPPYVGRGGWSWYTGAAAWMHRAAIESIFGLKITATTLSFQPCFPSSWSHAEITLRRADRTMRFIFQQNIDVNGTIKGIGDQQVLEIGEIMNWTRGPLNAEYLIPIP
jgi:cyclic beta-1,2-glucan synthetase